MLAVRPNRVVQAGRRLEHEVAFPARPDEANELGAARHRVATAANLRTEAELDEVVEAILEPVVDRRLDVDLADLRNARTGIEVRVRLDCFDPRVVRDDGVQHHAHTPAGVRQLTEPRRETNEPPQHERMRTLPCTSIFRDRIG